MMVIIISTVNVILIITILAEIMMISKSHNIKLK